MYLFNMYKLLKNAMFLIRDCYAAFVFGVGLVRMFPNLKVSHLTLSPLLYLKRGCERVVLYCGESEAGRYCNLKVDSLIKSPLRNLKKKCERFYHRLCDGLFQNKTIAPPQQKLPGFVEEESTEHET